MRRCALAGLPVIASILALASCGGTGGGTSVAVTVTDRQGKPVATASVSVDDSQSGRKTDANGLVRLELGRGTHRIQARAAGYRPASKPVTATRGQALRISLSFAPPLGTFVSQDASNQWYVLTISSASPVRATLRGFFWDCAAGRWSTVTRHPQIGDAENTFGYDPDGKIRITGPNRLEAAWLEDDGSLLPKTSIAAEPVGTCVKGAPAWQSPIGAIGPLASSPSSLRLLQAALGKPIYWIGRRAGVTYELRRLASGSTYVRYVPHGVPIGTSGYLIVGSYPVKFALASLRQFGKGPKAKLLQIPNGSAVYLDNFPKTAYVAYAGSDWETEVFDPTPGDARKLVAAGAVRPVGS